MEKNAITTVEFDLSRPLGSTRSASRRRKEKLTWMVALVPLVTPGMLSEATETFGKQYSPSPVMVKKGFRAGMVVPVEFVLNSLKAAER